MHGVCIAVLVVQSLVWLFARAACRQSLATEENLRDFCDTLPVHDDDLGLDTRCTNLSVKAQGNIETDKKPQLLTPTGLDDTLRSKHLRFSITGGFLGASCTACISSLLAIGRTLKKHRVSKKRRCKCARGRPCMLETCCRNNCEPP